MEEVELVTKSLQPGLDLVGKPVTGLDGKVIGKVTSVQHKIDHDGSDSRYKISIDDAEAWDKIRATMMSPVGYSFEGKAMEGPRVSRWTRFRLWLGEHVIHIGKKIRG